MKHRYRDDIAPRFARRFIILQVRDTVILIAAVLTLRKAEVYISTIDKQSGTDNRPTSVNTAEISSLTGFQDEAIYLHGLAFLREGETR